MYLPRYETYNAFGFLNPLFDFSEFNMANFEKILMDVGPKGLALIAGTVAAGFGIKESLFSGIFFFCLNVIIRFFAVGGHYWFTVVCRTKRSTSKLIWRA